MLLAQTFAFWERDLLLRLGFNLGGCFCMTVTKSVSNRNFFVLDGMVFALHVFSQGSCEVKEGQSSPRPAALHTSFKKSEAF